MLVTLEELTDSYWDLEAFLRDLMGQRLYRGLVQFISKGALMVRLSLMRVVHLPLRLLRVPRRLPTLTSWLSTAALTLHTFTNSTFVMNASTRTALLGVLDTTGRSLFQPALSAPAGADALGTLLGRPVVLDQFAPNIETTQKALAFGDFKSYYTLRNVGQFEIARDPYTYLVSKGAVAFIGYGRGGSFITDAGTHPVKVLTQHV